MTGGSDIIADDAEVPGTDSAGMMLRAARESAGLSIAAVAQQLKLAPRQVTALEEGDFANLPGRTFIRGFVRNYARLLRLDPDAVLAALPETVTATSLERPSLAPSRRPMGELPADMNARPNAARWAIPLALVAVVTIAAVYEIARPPGDAARPQGSERTAPPAAPQPAAPVVGTTTLPNPLAAQDKQDATPEGTTQAAPVAGDAQTARPQEPTQPAISLTFQGNSWVEVRDGTGTLILQVTGNTGNAQEVTGQPPFDVILGNAAAVSVSWQGQPFDIAPYTHQNVARFTLK